MNRDALSPEQAAIAADGVLVLHALFALYALLGAPLVLISPWTLLVHLPVVLWFSLWSYPA